jgi:hypothetical protein
VRSLDFFNLPAVSAGEEGFDLTRYEIEVGEGDERHVVTVEGEDTLDTTSLRRLVDFVSRR